MSAEEAKLCMVCKRKILISKFKEHFLKCRDELLSKRQPNKQIKVVKKSLPQQKIKKGCNCGKK